MKPLMIAVMAILPSLAWAQADPGRELLPAVRALSAGAFIKIQIADSQFTGRFVRLDGTDVVIRRYPDEIENVAASTVARLWESRGSSGGNGALAGGIIAGALGLGAGVLFGGMWCEHSCTGQFLGNVATATLYGAAVGAGIGGLIGLAIPAWQQRFP
jgi:hypothetical protein